MIAVKEILEKYWGYNAFRPLQEEIILSVLSKKDTIALMPTSAVPGGGDHQSGKSRQSRPGPGPAQAAATRTSRLSRQSPERWRRHRRVAGIEPQRGSARETLNRKCQPDDHGQTQRRSGPLARRRHAQRRAADQGAVGPGARIPPDRALQPRRRPPRGEADVRRRPGDAGPRLPQTRSTCCSIASRPSKSRSASSTTTASRRPGRSCSATRKDRVYPSAVAPAGARLLLPRADLSPRRRERAAAAGQVST